MKLARLANVSVLGLLLFGGPTDICCLEFENSPNGIILIWCDEDIFPEAVLAQLSCSDSSLAAEGFAAPRVTIVNPAEKVIPLMQAEDDDPKDVKLKKGKYPLEPVKRARMIGKQDGAAGTWFFETAVSGSYQAGLLVGFDDSKTKGLLDDQSSVFLEVRGLPAVEEGDAPFFTRVSATWDADIAGFVVSASTADGPLGEPVPFGGPYRQLQLQITQEPDGLQVSAFVADFGAGASEGFPSFFADVEEPAPEGLFRGGFGVEGLGKKGQLFVANLSVQSLDLGVASGAVPSAMAGVAGLMFLDEALLLTQNPFGAEPASVAYWSDLAVESLVASREHLETAIAEGRLEETKQVQKSAKAIDRAIKRTEKLDSFADKLVEKGKTKDEPLAKRTLRAWIDTRVYLAQLFGFGSKNGDKLFGTVLIDV